MSRQVGRKMKHTYGRAGHDRHAEAYEFWLAQQTDQPVVHPAQPVQQPPVTFQGFVKRWFDERGYGFVAPDDGSADCFVHASTVQGEGYKTLQPGQRVQVVAVPGPRRPQAITVTVLPV